MKVIAAKVVCFLVALLVTPSSAVSIHRNAGHEVAPPVNESNLLARQEAHLYNEITCGGNSTAFTFSANAFLASFGPYVNNLWSVKLCGRGIFFFYSTPDQQKLASLGHLARCKDVTSSLTDCTCMDIPPEVRNKVQSMSLTYC